MNSSEITPELKEWISQELSKLGIQIPKIKKILYQINKRNQKIRAESIFGASITQQIITEGQIVPFLLKSTDHLLPLLDHKCIFRKRGQDARIKQLKAHIENGGDYSNEVHPDDVASLFKAWLRELPVPLLPNEYHDFILNCHECCKENSTAMLLALSLLPTSHLTTLKFILEFLAKVSARSSINGMNSESLAVVFAPNIFPGSLKNVKTEKTSAKMLREQESKERDVVLWLIDHSDEVSRLPQSVHSLASLFDPNLQLCREQLMRQKKRRKSVTGFTELVGGKIKKIVQTEHKMTPKETLSRRRSVRRSIRGNTKRLLSSAPLERQAATPKSILKSKDVNLKPIVVEKKNGVENISNNSPDANTLPQPDSIQTPITPSPSCTKYTETPNSVFESPPLHNSGIIISGKTIESIENQSSKTDPAEPIPMEISGKTTPVQHQISLNQIETAENNWSRGHSTKKSLKRGRPNTLASGLKSTATRKAKKRSNSSISYVSRGSTRSKISRKSISSCDLSKPDELVQKKLDFSMSIDPFEPLDSPSKNTRSQTPVVSPIANISFGFTPNAPISLDFTPNPPISLNFSPTRALDLEVSPKVMTSTPAKSKWECAEKYLSSNSMSCSDDSLEGSKRDSIIELKKRNAGKVLANVHLYNTIQNNNGLFSPAANIRFKRNGIATMSVREKPTQLKDAQGFVVPKGIPSSAKRRPATPGRYRMMN